MEKFIAIDSGKFATKVAVFDAKENKTHKFSFRTKIGPGDFDDDALERNTFIAEIDGVVYKTGNGAVQEAELETSKKSEVHRICTLEAIAMYASSTEVDEFNVAIGLPAKEWAVVKKRNEYKDYILPDGEVTINLKTKSDGPIETKTFKIKKKFVFAESIGALFLDNATDLLTDTAAGVIDIGNLNINATMWQDFELQQETSLTDELGGSIMISGLSQLLSAEFSRCDKNYVAKILKLKPEERMLRPVSKDEKVEKRSKQLIDRFLLDHVNKIKQCCNTKQWSLEFMPLVCIGGTSALIKNELEQVFGQNVYVPENPEFANVLGFLRLLCVKTYDDKKLIPLK